MLDNKDEKVHECFFFLLSTSIQLIHSCFFSYMRFRTFEQPCSESLQWENKLELLHNY